MAIRTHAAMVLAALALAGCGSGPGTIVTDRPVSVKVPVVQGCAGQRPAKVVPLREKVPPKEWAGRDVRQKVATVGAQALDHQQYGEDLDGATGACPAAR